MSEPLLRDGLSDFGRALFEAADAEAPSPAARQALLAAVVGTAAVTTAVTATSAAAVAAKGGVATHAGASAGLSTTAGASTSAGLATSAGAVGTTGTGALVTAGAGAAGATGAGAGVATSAAAALATKGGAALGLKLLVASAIGVATAAVAVDEIRNVDVPLPGVVATVASGGAAHSREPADPAVGSSASTLPDTFDEPTATATEEMPLPRDEVPVAMTPVAETTRAPAPPSIDSPREPPSLGDVNREPPPVEESPSMADRTSTDDPSSMRDPSSGSATPTGVPAEGDVLADEHEKAASLGAQIASIDAARAELRAGNARGALATIDAFERRYGRSAPLTPEAMLVRVQAHLALGDRGLAARAATELKRDHPTSVSARRAASLVGTHD